MNGGPSRASIIGTIIAKDVKTFLRDRFWLFMTFLALFWVVGIFYLMPDTVDETLDVGVHRGDMGVAFDEVFAEVEGIEWVDYESSAALEEALGLGDEEPEDKLLLGIDFAPDFRASVDAGSPTKVTVHYDPNVPEEVQAAIALMLEEGAYGMVGEPLPVTPLAPEESVLGEDRLGRQVPDRDRLRPMFAFMMLLIETLALGVLVAEEVATRTASAVVVTPARTTDLLAAKVVLGTVLAFTEAAFVMLLVGGFAHQPLIIALALLLGGVLVTGVALLTGASGREMLSLMFYSMLFLIPLVIPVFAVLFPGSASTWIKVLPTYGLIQVLQGVSAYGDGWSEALPHLGTLAAWCVVILAAGVLVMKRRVETL